MTGRTLGLSETTRNLRTSHWFVALACLPPQHPVSVACVMDLLALLELHHIVRRTLIWINETMTRAAFNIEPRSKPRLAGPVHPPQRRAWALGIFGSVTGIAVLAGPVVGGAVTQGLDWTWIFWLNVPIGAVMIPLVL